MSTNNQPLVSVIMGYYNGQKYVEEAIKSIYGQTYKNIELIIVDDCSPDLAAREYIKKLAEKYPFKLLYNQENIGASRTVIRGFAEAKGDYITLTAQDDLYLPERIAYLMELLQKDNLDVVYCNGAYFHDDNKEKYKAFDDDAVISAQKFGQEAVTNLLSSKDTIGCLLMQGALMTHRFMAETLPLRNQFMIDDWPLTIIAWRDYKVKYDSKLVYLYRLHKNNIHKDYWKWLPGRFQVISELVPDKQKWNTVANILADVGNVVMTGGNKICGYKILLAALMLSEDNETTMAVSHELAKRQKELSKLELHHAFANLRKAIGSATCYNIIGRRMLKLIINFVPIKKWRKRLKAKYL